MALTKMRSIRLALCAGVAAAALSSTTSSAPVPAQASAPPIPERHLAGMRRLTSGGENAEAYFSSDGRRLIFQSTRAGVPCDQIFVMDADGANVQRVSPGTGRATCGYFYPGDMSFVYASTHGAADECPPRPGYERGYVWPVYPTYDIYRVRGPGAAPERLTDATGYDAEATIGADGRIVFTSTRDGDIEIYSMAADGSDERRLTRRPGPDGGPVFSPDGRLIVFRGRALAPGAELDDYRLLLKEHLWRPTTLEIFVMNRDGGEVRQVTSLGGANFAPAWHPDGRRIIFASNWQDPKGRNFDLFLVNVDGSGLEQITSDPTFDGFPMFSPDGRRLVFASNRGARAEGETNVFVANWNP
jgi:Tol biopolymer transport system component